MRLLSMSKLRSGLDNKQISIFELLRQLSTANRPSSNEGRCCVIEGLRGALRDAIKASPLSRHQIAGEMSHLVGQTITKEQLDSWTREDQRSEPQSLGTTESGTTIRRHVPAEYLPAFCKVTGAMEPLRLLAEAAGFFVLPGPEALRAEIHRIDEEIKDRQSKKRARSAFLKEMEKPKSRQD
jgi:hypothetical protein